MSSFVDAGIDLLQAFDVFLKECPPGMRKTIGKVKKALEEGQPLSEALRTHAPKMFPVSFYAALEVGEKSGALADTLKLVDRQYEDMVFLKRRITGMIFYPVFVLSLCAGVTLFLLLNVVPTFAEIFGDLGGSLPFPTRALVMFKSLFWNHALLSIFALACALISIRAFLSLARRASPFSKILFRIPFLGPIAYHSNLFRFSSLMTLLLASGLSVHEALSLCENDATWPVFKNAIGAMGRDMAEGKAFSDTLVAQEIFSPTLVWLVAVGEQRGNMTDSFKAAAEHEMAILQYASGLLPSLFRPVTVVVMGAIIGFAIVALWLPILKMPNLLFPD